MKNLINHLKTITKHKIYVLIECWKRGLYLQGILHDLSKYSFLEFFTSVKNYQGHRSPVGAEKAKKGYSHAWLNHKSKNKHHWEYWTDFKNGKVLLCPIPDKYVVEMTCDMIGASKAYLKDKYTKKSPLAYFLKNKSIIMMNKKDKLKLEKLLTTERDK